MLREASRLGDLTGYLDRDTLIAVWPELHLPKGVQQAWQEHHPQLRRVAWDALMPVSDLYRQIAALALAAAGEHGFALGGGNALRAHRVISRSTQDVGLFTGREHGVQAAAGAVEATLRGAGFEPGQQDQAGLTGEGLAEWIVTAPGGEQMALQLAYYDRGREPVMMDISPVLDLKDVMDGMVCALASRIEPRDADVAAALQRYAPSQLIRLARPLDPGLTGRDFADAGLRLDQMTDTRFADVGLSQADVTALRETVRRLGPGRRSDRPATAGRERRRATARAVAGVSRVRMTLTQPGRSSGPDRTAPLKPTGTTRRPSHDLTGPP